MYDHKTIEKKWQDFWEKNKTFNVENTSDKPWFYALDMFPYPSGAGLHVGHPEGYTANDIVARYKNAKGFNVLHPMGWDAFGLPAENYAIKTGTHPRITTDENIATFKRQIKSLGLSYDWDREIDTTDPKYFKWTQWIFLRLFEAGLAYEQDLPINYCPSCKTGLANEEVLNDNSCERCGEQVEKKKIRQWVLAITKYADRLNDDVEKLDWPEGIKEMQRNWIGRSEWCEFEMKKSDDESKSIRVYTTRIDTVFGMTYAVMAPDHPHVSDFIEDSHRSECEKYIADVSKESDQERIADNKEKTGVFTGSYVINPYNGEKIPVWIADYVLWNYGTWAVMAVPAHDERDFEFAKKFDIEIRQVVAPKFSGKWIIALKESVETLPEKVYVNAIVEYDGKFLVLEESSWCKFVWGGLEQWETYEEAIRREIIEETGFTDYVIVWAVPNSWYYASGYRPAKNINQQWMDVPFYHVKLNSLESVWISEEESEIHSLKWLEKSEVKESLFSNGHLFAWDYFINPRFSKEDGLLMNSWKYDKLSVKEAQNQMIEKAESEWFWHKKVNYKLRDWLFSRQRYWGEPIPLIHLDSSDFENLKTINDLNMAREDDKAYILDFAHFLSEEDEGKEQFLVVNKEIFGKIYDGLYGKIVCDYKLPLELPEVEDFAPAGDWQSPLANVDEFVNIKLAENLKWKRETNTMPQWGGSCWYYLRFMDPHNDEELVSKEVAEYWGSVDSYVWGAEHAVLHLLYARFWHKFLYDEWVVVTDEPFQKLKNQGMILAYSYENSKGKLIVSDLVEEKWEKFFHKETGEELKQVVAKMSKSLKNVVNPDDIVQEYGADSLRLYEMYMADFKDTAPWNTKNILWVRRFLDKVERAFTEVDVKKAANDNEAMKNLHKTIKKVGEDIENYKFNTAIAQMMILVNYGRPSDEKLFSEWKESFAIILSAFAPHLWEELWSILWNTTSVFHAPWPEYDEKMVVDDTIVIGVQVLWKLRGEIEIAADEAKDSVLEKAKAHEWVAKWLEWKELVKEIYVPGRIVNLVVK